MLFTTGTKVQFIHTGDVGVITEMLSDDMVNVLLDDDDMEIPVAIENLKRVTEDHPPDTASSHLQKPPVKAKFVAGKKKPTPVPPPKSEIETQYRILKSMGIQLAFAPEFRPDGSTEKYQIYLLNDTRYDALYTYSFSVKGSVLQKMNGKIASVSYENVGELLFDQLNDNPLVEMECWQVTTKGTGAKLHKSLKIKPKAFFKGTKTAPILDQQVHLFPLFKNFEEELPKKEEDLKTYTQRNARKPKRGSLNYNRFDISNPNELASFQNEIDLHIEKLVTNTSKLSNSDILRIQLSHFESFIAKAIQLGVGSVFIIHGIGKGKLRNAIATSLLNNPDVKTFKNEFHPRYGWGATEVIL